MIASSRRQRAWSAARRGSMLLVALAAGASRATAPTSPPGIKVEGILEVHEAFASSVLADTVQLHVYLPPSYAREASRRYPVLYALDAQNLFDDALAAGGEEWTLDEILVRRPEGVPEMLVVGVVSGANAVRNLALPGSMPGARGDRFLDFLAGELKSFTDGTYRTRDHAWIMGHAGSALLALYAAWQRPSIFAAALAFDVPDVNATTSAWAASPPQGGRPWLWLEQGAADKARPSTTELVARLQRHADVRVVVSGAQASRTARLLTALRAVPPP